MPEYDHYVSKNGLRPAWNQYLEVAKLVSWFEQFGSEHWQFVLKMLAAFQFYSSRRTEEACSELLRQIELTYAQAEYGPGSTFQTARQNSAKRLAAALFLPIELVAKSGLRPSVKSGHFLLYKLKALAQFAMRTCTSIAELDMALRGKALTDLVICDDFVGKADQALAYWTGAVAPQLRKRGLDSTAVTFAVIAGMRDGIEALEHLGARVVCLDMFERADQVFDTASPVFRPSEREEARNVVRSYGERACPSRPLGYRDSRLLVAFEHMTPDNTISVFWAHQSWLPLFPARDCP